MAETPIPKPPARNLRVFAFDPGLATRLETVPINEAVLAIPWEDDLKPGPIGEYLEVIDYDPASRAFYGPVDLDQPYLLTQDGLAPSEGNPMFHQQMVYAVAMKTIHHYERALGRRVLWATRRVDQPDGGIREEYVQRLRIYPHAMREANAYYSPEKKALLFGYFTAAGDEVGANLPGGMVFTCLSHDVIAHEMTHALLDGLHPRFIEATNPDTLALHEAFADVVALFQHFTQPEALRDQIAKTRGDLRREENLLGQLARQFGEAIGRRGALRDAIGRFDSETNEWKPHKPDPTEILTTREPHRRGAILVAAVFDAFLAIYGSRIEDLKRIATGGTGVLPEGSLNHDLVERMAQEASKSAGHVLEMCIRALDYLPPVDVTFGDFLRALVTADYDLVPEDERGYRIAVIEAFRKRGIYPRDVRSLAADSLRWEAPRVEIPPLDPQLVDRITRTWNLQRDRRQIYDHMQQYRQILHQWLHSTEFAEETWNTLGLTGDPESPRTVSRSRRHGRPALEVHSIRPAQRIGPDGQQQVDVVVELTQRRWGFFDPDVQKTADATGKPNRGDFKFRGGCTVLIDVESWVPRYCVYKSVLNNNRLHRVRRYLRGEDTETLHATYFGASERTNEPFALMHRRFEQPSRSPQK